ncbi:hypothetical protein F4824DRAFT_493088 [Ustulina deusta]|nr:hypothetical protein F4823DRAFT_618120 [Ustulina deusta]KAI3328517.1 hypothetical protein F4824DRAFT_493088 [Ustulina deusta]
MAFPPPPAGLDLGESQAPQIYAGLLIPWIFAVVNVCLRFTARRLTRGGFIRVEDWLVLVALIPATIQVFTVLGYSVPHGVGRHVWAAPADSIKVWSLGLFIAEITYTITIVLVKYSTLVFYWHVFGRKKSIRLPIWILSGVTSLWGIAVILVSCFQCFPTRAIWERFDPVHPIKEYTCPIDVSGFVIGNAVPNIITDGLVVLLPLPYVLSLQLRFSQKVALAGIFLLGLLVTLTSIIRLALFQQVPYNNPDVTWAFCAPIIWSNVECNLAIAVSCLPFLKPILNFIIHRQFSDPSTSLNKSVPTRNTHMSGFGLGQQGDIPYSNSNIQTSVTTKGEDKRPFARLSDTESAGSGGEDGIEMNNFDDGAILVTKEFRILNKEEEQGYYKTGR